MNQTKCEKKEAIELPLNNPATAATAAPADPAAPATPADPTAPAAPTVAGPMAPMFPRATRPPQPESELHRSLRENSRYYLLLAALAGAAYPLLFCSSHGVGINLPLFAAVWLAATYAALRKLSLWPGRRCAPYGAGILLLAFASFLTMNQFVQAVNIVGIVILMAMLLLEAFCDTRAWQLGKYCTAMLSLLGSAINKVGEPLQHLSALRKNAKQQPAGKKRFILLGLVISIPLAAIALSLLLAADQMFRELLRPLIDWDWQWSAALRTAIRALLGFIVVFYLFYCSLAGQTAKPVANGLRPVRHSEPLVAITFTSVLTLIYLVFCVVQVIYLFVGREGALPAGFTYAAYAREGFFQLLLVSGLNAALVIFSAWKFGESRWLRLLLSVICGCTYIMIASSAFRMLLYVEAYGLTFLRLLVLWFLLLLAVLIAAALISIYRPGFRLFRFALYACLALWLCFGLAKPDRIAAEYNAVTIGINDETVQDMIYGGLSMDAVPVMIEYGYAGEQYAGAWYRYLLHTVPATYDQQGLRAFNLSLWQAAQSVAEE